MPSAISVNMFGLRLTMEIQARSKNGHPAQKTTGVARITPIQFGHAPCDIVSAPPLAMSIIVSAKTGAEAARRSRSAASSRPARDWADRRA